MNDECQLIIFEPRKKPRTVSIQEKEVIGDRIPTYDEHGNILTNYKILYNELEEESQPNRKDIVKYIKTWEAQNKQLTEKQKKRSEKRKRIKESRKRQKERNRRLKRLNGVAPSERDPLEEEERAIIEAMKEKTISIKKMFNIKPSTCIPLDTNFKPSENPSIVLKRRKIVDTVVLDDSDDDSCDSDNIRLNIDNAVQSSSGFTKDGPFRSYKSFITSDDLSRKKKKKVEIVQISDSSDSDVECVPIEEVIEAISDDDDDSKKKSRSETPMEVDNEKTDENTQLAGLVDQFVNKYIQTVLPSLPTNPVPQSEPTPEKSSVKKVTFSEIVECDNDDDEEDQNIFEPSRMEADTTQPLSDNTLLDQDRANRPAKVPSENSSHITGEEIDSDCSISDLDDDSDNTDIDFYDLVPSPNYDPVDVDPDIERLSDTDVEELSRCISSHLNKKASQFASQQLQNRNQNFAVRGKPFDRHTRGRSIRPLGERSQNSGKAVYHEPASGAQRFSQLYDEMHKAGPKIPDVIDTSKKHEHPCYRKPTSNSQLTPLQRFLAEDDEVARDQYPTPKKRLSSLPPTIQSDFAETCHEVVPCVQSEPGPFRKRPFQEPRLQNFNRPIGLAQKFPMQGTFERSYQSEPLQNEQFEDFEDEKVDEFEPENYHKPTQRYRGRGNFHKRPHHFEAQNEQYQDDQLVEYKPQNNQRFAGSRFRGRSNAQKSSRQAPVQNEQFEEDDDFEEKPQNYQRFAGSQFQGRGNAQKNLRQPPLRNEQFEEDDGFEEEKPHSRFQNNRYFNQNLERKSFGPRNVPVREFPKRNLQWRGYSDGPRVQPQNQRRFPYQAKGFQNNLDEPFEEEKYHPPPKPQVRPFNPQKNYSCDKNVDKAYEEGPTLNESGEPYEEEKFRPGQWRGNFNQNRFQRKQNFSYDRSADEPYEEEKYHPPPKPQVRPFNPQKNYSCDKNVDKAYEEGPPLNESGEPYEEEKFRPGQWRGNFSQNRFQRNQFRGNRFNFPASHQERRNPNPRFQNRPNFQNRFNHNLQIDHRFQGPRPRFQPPATPTTKQSDIFSRRPEKIVRPNTNNLVQPPLRQNQHHNTTDLQRYETNVLKKFNQEPLPPGDETFSWENNKGFDFVPILVDEPIDPPWNDTSANNEIRAISRRSWINDNVMNHT